MYQNVKDTQNELREQHPVESRRPKTSNSDNIDMKNHSSGKNIIQQILFLIFHYLFLFIQLVVIKFREGDLNHC